MVANAHKFRAALILPLLLPLVLFGAREQQRDGRWWNSLTLQGKSDYVLGLADGSNLSDPDLEYENDTQLIAMLNVYYAEERNRTELVSVALPKVLNGAIYDREHPDEFTDLDIFYCLIIGLFSLFLVSWVALRVARSVMRPLGLNHGRALQLGSKRHLDS